MGQFYSGADLKRGALQRAGEPTNGKSDFDQVCLKYLNQIYFNIVSGSNEFDIDCGEPWLWARSPAPLILTLKAPIDSDTGGGTASVVSGSNSVTLSIAPTNTMKNQYFYLNDGTNPEKYQIIAHAANSTTLTLDGPYNGPTNATAPYRILQIVYRLGGEDQILRLVEPFRVYKMTWDEDRNYQVYGLDSNSFNFDYPIASIVDGVPTRFMVFQDSVRDFYVRFNEVPAEISRCEVDYIPVPSEIIDSDSSIPIIPRAFRTVLEYGATYLLMLDKNDRRAQSYLALTQAKMKALIEWNRKQESNINSKSKGAIQTRQENLRVRQRLRSFVEQF